jgi:hypothetical protein
VSDPHGLCNPTLCATDKAAVPTSRKSGEKWGTQQCPSVVQRSIAQGHGPS